MSEVDSTAKTLPERLDAWAETAKSIPGMGGLSNDASDAAELIRNLMRDLHGNPFDFDRFTGHVHIDLGDKFAGRILSGRELAELVNTVNRATIQVVCGEVTPMERFPDSQTEPVDVSELVKNMSALVDRIVQAEKQSRLTALNASIQKWKNIIDNGGVDRGADNCALCQMYEDDCTGCPVCEDTGKHSCDGTPYIEWSELCVGYPKTADTPESKESAKKMRDYLISLVPRVESGEL